MRDNIILRCTECGEENYIDTRNKKTHPERKEIRIIPYFLFEKIWTEFSLI